MKYKTCCIIVINLLIKADYRTYQCYSGAQFNNGQPESLLKTPCGEIKRESKLIGGFKDSQEQIALKCINACKQKNLDSKNVSLVLDRKIDFTASQNQNGTLIINKDPEISTTQKIKDFANSGYQTIQDARKFLSLQNMVKSNLKNYYSKDNPFANTQAQVRNESNIPFKEIQIIKTRQAINNKTLNEILEKKIEDNQNLKIAFCASGGGYRALTATLGSLQAAKHINLLEAVTYMAGLSGGAWALATWISSKKSIDEFINLVSNNLDLNKKSNNIKMPVFDNTQLPNVIGNLFDIYIYDLPLTSVDLWGAMIIDNILSPLKNRHKLKLSLQEDIIKNGSKPFPIYTAVEPLSNLNYNWFEFTPLEIGNITRNYYVPTWGFGRNFINGKSAENSPELPLDFYLGVFGSAFTLSPEELETKMNITAGIIQYLHEKFPTLSVDTLNQILDLKKFIAEIDDKYIKLNAASKRFLPGEVANPTYELNKDPKKNTILIDAGIDFNLPLPPLLRPEREIDIIFILDASGSVADGTELLLAEKDAKKNNLKFPKIDYKNIHNKTISIFGLESKDHKVPIIIYMPRINPVKNMSKKEIDNLKLQFPDKAVLIDKLKTFDVEKCVDTSFCSTFNFAYSKEDFSLISTMTYLNMAINKKTIFNAIKDAFNRKYN